MNKKVIVGIILGVLLLTSLVSVISLPTNTAKSKIESIEFKREQKIEYIIQASQSFENALIGDTEFISIIDQSIMDTDNLYNEYSLLELNDVYDKYKKLSLDSLATQKEAFLKLKEYVQTKDESVRAEFDQLLTKSFEYRRDALRELN